MRKTDGKLLSFPEDGGPWVAGARYIVPLPFDRTVGTLVSEEDLENALYFDIRSKAFRAALLEVLRDAGGARKGDVVEVAIRISRLAR